MYGATPPVGVTVIAPSQTPQLASVTLSEIVIGPGSFTVARESLLPAPVRPMFHSKMKPLSAARLSVMVMVQSPLRGHPIKPDNGCTGV